MSVFEPEYTWIASGGANMLNFTGCLDCQAGPCLPRQEFDNWKDRTKSFFNRQMDGRVEKHSERKSVKGCRYFGFDIN